MRRPDLEVCRHVTHVQSTCLKISSKKGTPASTPPDLAQRIASCSSSPTTSPAQSNDGVSSWYQRGMSCFHDGGRRNARLSWGDGADMVMGWMTESGEATWMIRSTTLSNSRRAPGIGSTVVQQARSTLAAETARGLFDATTATSTRSTVRHGQSPLFRQTATHSVHHFTSHHIFIRTQPTMAADPPVASPIDEEFYASYAPYRDLVAAPNIIRNSG